ncbi:zinc finger protein [Seiridium cupressi]
MRNLLAQGSAAELDEELTVKFPAGLDEAYGRVAARVLDSPSRHQAQKEAASNILRWMTCTVRPLKWREIQTLFCLDPEKGSCNPRKRRVDDCKTLCGSFIDTEHRYGNIEEFESSIHFVHDTARRYLIHSGRVDLARENASMAIYSMRYLASFPLGNDQSREAIINTAVSGYYGLLDYTVSSWQHHNDKAHSEQDHLSLTDAVNLRDAQKTFLEIHKIDTPDQNAAVLDKSVDTMPKLTNEKHRDCIQDLESRCSSVTKIIETIQPKLLGTAEQKSFLALNGKPRFKCSKPQCRMFFEGFSSRASRDEHINKHEMQFLCPKDSCPHRALGFSSRPELERHVMASHPPETDLNTMFPSPREEHSDIFSTCTSGNLSRVKLLLKSHITAAIVSGTQEIMDQLRSWETTRQQRLDPVEIFGSAVATRGINRRGTDLYELFFADLEVGVKLEIISATDVKGREKSTADRGYDPELFGGAARLLIESNAGIDIAAVSPAGRYALHFMCRQLTRVNHDFVLELLDSVLAKAPDLVNVQNSDGATPLHIAVDVGFAEGVSKLLETGICDLSLKGSNGDTVLDLANKSTRSAKEEILTLLHLA